MVDDYPGNLEHPEAAVAYSNTDERPRLARMPTGGGAWQVLPINLRLYLLCATQIMWIEN